MAEHESRLVLDADNLFAEAVGDEHGLSRSALDALAGPVEQFTAQIEARRGKDIGFMELPHDAALADAVQQQADELRSWCRNFVVLGIGGSALGNKTLHAALQHPYHDLLPATHARRMPTPRVFVLDNVDPDAIGALLDALGGELAETAFNVITKSGSTAETMSQFLHMRDLLARTGGCDPVRQIVLTTDADPAKSLLRRIAERDGYAALPIPANVGGRFSVLSAVGLLGAAMDGVDVAALLGGAAAMDARCRAAALAENPAALYASALYLLYRKGKPVTVLMPYDSSLRALADWYCQLWAESLGKRDGLAQKDLFVGPTPVASVGVTDQHSVMQLYQDGPFDKVTTFIEVEKSRRGDLPICEGEAEPELAYLGKHTFGELLSAELAATRCALRDKHRPNCTMRIPQVDAASLGELFMFFEHAVTYSGCLYEVNAFDQPGVELGKQYTYGLMGREGYEPPAT